MTSRRAVTLLKSRALWLGSFVVVLLLGTFVLTRANTATSSHRLAFADQSDLTEPKIGWSFRLPTEIDRTVDAGLELDDSVEQKKLIQETSPVFKATTTTLASSSNKTTATTSGGNKTTAAKQTTTTTSGTNKTTTTKKNTTTTKKTTTTTRAITTTAATPKLNNVTVPSWGAYFGMNSGDWKNGISVQSREAQFGHQMAIERLYNGPDVWTLSNINIDLIERADDGGRIPMVSYQVPDWHKVINGNNDAIIDKLALLIKESEVPTMLTIHYQPENEVCNNNNPSCGKGQTSADYVTMWRHVHNRFEALGVDNVSWNWIHMGWQMSYDWPSEDDRQRLNQTYPGDAYVDWVSGSIHNSYSFCYQSNWHINHNYDSFQAIGQGWYNWAKGFGKPIAVAEWGTMKDSWVPGRKATWIQQAGSTIKSWSKIKAVVYADNQSNGSCDWRVDNDGSGAVNAYKNLLADSYFING